MKYLFLIVLFSLNFLSAQDLNKSYINNEIKSGDALLKASRVTYSGDESIDILYYKLDLDLSTSLYLFGNVTVNASPLLPQISSFFLDLNNSLIIDSVVSRNQKLLYQKGNDKLFITLDKDYLLNEEFSVTIYYQGEPLPSGFGSFEFNTTNSGKPAIYTLSEPFGAKDWWPGKNSPSDKADSSDVWITCSKELFAVSNGLLEEVDTNNNDSKTYKWKNSYPIANYLISLAIADYIEYKTYFKYSETDSMPVIHYIYPETFNSVKTNLDETIHMLEVFSDKFGNYPFLREKYGHAEFGIPWFAMEHQTVSSMSAESFNTGTIAHELAHQWFGDKITCRDWHHIWLNEGFANYAEGIYYEAIGGKLQYDRFIADEMDRAKAAVGSIYVEDTTSLNEIFNGLRTYSKGGIVLHMLRGIAGDSLFFRILKTYANEPSLAYGTAVTEDFQSSAESVYGSGLKYFFDEWIYGTGFPDYDVKWNYHQLNNNLYEVEISIDQKQDNLFIMPVQFKLTTSFGDTVFTLFNDQKEQTFIFTASGTPVSLAIDPNNWILKSSSVTTGVRKETNIESFFLEQNYPNPFNPVTTIKFSLKQLNKMDVIKSIILVQLKVFDAIGNEVVKLIDEELSAGEYEIRFDASKLASGVYLYELKAGDHTLSRKMILMK